MAASGVHHLISNHQQILSETVYRALEVPLLEEMDSWQRRIEEEEVAYQKEARLRAKEIRRSETEGAKLQRAKRWDVTGLRSHLVGLTSKLDAFTALHGQHAQTLLRESQDISRKVVDCTSSLVRAEVEIFEGLARKGWAGGGLEELLEKGEDPFAMESDQTGHEENGASTIHSILPPRSILPSASQSLGVPRDGDKKPASFADGLSPQGGDEDIDERSIFFGPGIDQAMRPFSSPPPPHHHHLLILQKRETPPFGNLKGLSANRTVTKVTLLHFSTLRTTCLKGLYQNKTKISEVAIERYESVGGVSRMICKFIVLVLAKIPPKAHR